MTAYLTLNTLDLDYAQSRRLPRALALHHLALVVAEDEDSITVAMADPTNLIARQRIEAALGHSLTLVRSDPDAIRAALTAAWSDESVRGGLALGGDVTLRPMLAAYAKRFITSALPTLAMESHLPPRLLIASPTDPKRRESTILSADISVWLCLDPTRSPKRILVAIRTGAPDWQAAEWASLLARAHGSQVMLLAASPRASGAILSGHAAYLNPDDPRGAHVADLALILTSQGVHGRLKVREGSFTESTIAECLEARPDLLIIGAEQAGQQAAHILSQIGDSLGALLVLKA
jgi:hypothetical protein